ncbi:hypothetical protein FB645_000930 [Coemansia sp. IMI 203386]|nr:hypothetical protein FB645_000930 [Coemansia sp. IMI 203386]
MQVISTLSLVFALSTYALAAPGNPVHAHNHLARVSSSVNSYPPASSPKPTPPPALKRRGNSGATRRLFKGKAKSFVPALGACGENSTESDLVVALNREQYGGSDTSQYCGQCVEVSGDVGTLVLKVVDICKGCGYGNLNIATNAYSQITTGDSVGDITWKFTTC